MTFTEQQVAEALGVGGKMQEIADPAQHQDPAAGTEQPTVTEPEGDVTEPGGAQTHTGSETEPTTGGVEDTSGSSGSQGEGQPQTVEQRRENAARRRQQEQQAAIDSAVAAARQEEREKINADTKAFFEQANITNHITGEPITNMEEFMAWQEQHRKAQLEKDLRDGNLSPDLLDEIISRHPAVQKAQALIDQSAANAATTQQAAMAAQIEAEMLEIQKLDPTIQSVDDLKNMPAYQPFYELVGKGYSFVDAFRLANFDRLTAQAAQNGREQAAANARSKDHLLGAGNSRGAGAVSVPKGEMELYRLLNPKATDAQIQAHYNKHKPK